MRVARALGSLPETEQALGRGELSYAKVRALTRVATPQTEQRLLELARHATAAQMERLCRGYRQVQSYLRDEPIPPEDRSVRERPLPGGMVRLELTLAPDEAALVLKAVEKARDQLRAQAAAQSPVPPDASAETPPPSRADGVVHLVETFLQQPAAGTGAKPVPNYEIMVHLDQDVLAADGDWAATLDDGSRVSAETFRRLACDTALVTTATTNMPGAGKASGAALDIGRRTRSIPPAIRRALWLRDRGCRFPGCLHTRFLHGHHIQHWIHGGATRLDNLVLLCSRHHHLIHEGGFTVDTASDGTLQFRAPTRKPIPWHPPRHEVEDAAHDLEQWARDRDVDITPATNLPWWDGAVPDYDWAIRGLLD